MAQSSDLGQMSGALVGESGSARDFGVEESKLAGVDIVESRLSTVAELGAEQGFKSIVGNFNVNGADVTQFTSTEGDGIANNNSDLVLDRFRAPGLIIVAAGSA
eukprot:CAMPEP_0168751192 /NCGR_PEP_ID=MMETSP0724-20121128/17691_1 /TAXON_ID=265536 /ORGANISM="Amphiprora sp., Strain CCMP467" /LENGTH=103 /DNA_ID=CAMNT_0008799297 /DNA_START=1225 /DNA_END=1534 /DNA_ORIENTATION=-